jgi:hypothetical protein
MESDLTFLVQLYDGIFEVPTRKLTLGYVRSTPTSKVPTNTPRWATFLLVKHFDGETKRNKIVHR